MKNYSILMFVFLIVFALGFQTVSAQFTITIPKIPKIKKPKPDSTTNETKQKVQTSDQKTPSPDSTQGDTMDPITASFLNDIAIAQKAVDAYTPEEKTYLVRDGEYNWLLRAVSPSEREKWNKKSLKKPGDLQKFNDALDVLAASVAKKMPLYQANPKIYNFHNAAEEKMMKEELENPATTKIYKIGLNQNSWLISKNDYGLPTSRYKNGMIWLRDPANDHPYCKIYYVNIIQDYSGGGTYGASYAEYVGGELAGCPAGK